MISVGVIGASGKMGSQVVSAVLNDVETKLVCAIDKFNIGKEIIPNLFINDDIEKTIINTKPDIVVDFTQPDIIFDNIQKYMNLKVKSVIGTTGLTLNQINEIKKI